ncbi:MAG: sugar ABC transporter ATP-binding protein [Nocardioidaceae bacterium]|nr:sugar ABC transporter ATP-binding protein [Nocardioidaceae bacterium]
MSAPLLRLDGVAKRYGGLQALDGISFEATGGEVIALLGDNGAGKSTLMKVLAGAESADEGTISVRGEARDIRSPRQAEQLGIEMVYQDLALVGTLDAAENLHLGREPRRRGLAGRLGFIDRASMRRETVEQMQRLGVTRLSLRRTVTMLSGGQRQAIAIARATSRGSGSDADRILLLDEPTAALGVGQQRRVQELITRLRERGMLVIVISHDLAACFEVADRLVVLRQGRKVADVRTEETSTQEVVGWITGAAEVGAR